ncbi:glycosyltransferase family 4 protein [Perlabentimonas gracilis]|uniref:glycosyltransferase family 4 protein n=1 Tax=Perlabentimonas gracilis TaxID=2715279 RepID=UPI001407F2B3|nr:glycosyltransferase family 4 protein [Perlabentimonas gracilis]NHB70196.1 glycosyltransferase family 4 protein [Perlabentimonas gracilis]
MKIFIISIYSFPLGLAPTNRIIAYSKGLISNGADVTVILPFPTDKHTSTYLPKSGNYQGINYIYTSYRYKNKLKVFRAFLHFTGLRKLVGLFFASIYFLKNYKNKNIDHIVISTDEISTLFVFSIIGKICKAKSVFIFDEYPIPIRHKLKDRIPKLKEFLYRLVLKQINGYVSISEKLKEYYCNLSPKPTLILSSITDISRFKSEKRDCQLNDSYLCYMGNMELAKDDVDNIIKAFSIVSPKYPELTLRLYGSPNLKSKDYLMNIVNKLGLTNRVLFMGKITFDQVPSVLSNAKILVSSQPNTVRASGGFPTKLGEYLASGTPSIITDVGENSRYVKDGEHLFFVEPNNPMAYANKLVFVLENYIQALTIGERGKEYIFNNYSNTKKALEMKDFLDSLT